MSAQMRGNIGSSAKDAIEQSTPSRLLGLAEDDRDDATGKRPHPENTAETMQGHPSEDWTDMYDVEDPDAGRVDYPENIKDDHTDGDE